MPNFPRTDLAVEAEAIHRSAAAVTELPGVRAEETNRRGFSVTEVHVLDAAGENALCKPIGDYYTLALDPLLRREDDAFGVGQQRQVTTHLLGDLVAHDEVEVVVAPLVETFTLRTRAEQDEPEDLVARRDGRDEPLGETVEQLGGVVLGRAVRHGQPSSTTRPVADLFTRTACISVPSGRTNVRFSFVSPTDVARA